MRPTGLLVATTLLLVKFRRRSPTFKLPPEVWLTARQGVTVTEKVPVPLTENVHQSRSSALLIMPEASKVEVEVKVTAAAVLLELPASSKRRPK